MSAGRGKKPQLQPVVVPGGDAAAPVSAAASASESKGSGGGGGGADSGKRSDAVKPVVYARIGSRTKLVTEDEEMEEATEPPRAVRSPQSPKAGGRGLGHGEDDPALASLVHQTDASGKQQASSPPVSSVDVISKQRRKKGLWARLCCCCGKSDVQDKHVPPFGPIDPRESLLGPLHPDDVGKKCLVLDLDETLVHSSFKYVEGADYVIPVEIEGTTHHVYVCKRPFCDEFLYAMGKVYEVVVFTASLSKYADPLLDQLDKHKVIRKRLFRESCVHWEGNYVKDLSLLGRDIRTVIIIDNSPASFYFQPENAIACETYINQVDDRELRDMIKPLTDWSKPDVPDVRDVLARWPGLASGACSGTAAGLGI